MADQQLIDLFRQWQENEDAINGTHGIDDAGIEAFLARASALEERIVETPATTIEGLICKLRIACDDEGDDHAPIRAARAALQDAERIAALSGTT